MGSLKVTKHLLKDATSWWVSAMAFSTNDLWMQYFTKNWAWDRFVEITAPSNRGVHAFKQISTAYKWFTRYEMYWQRAVYFPLVDHLLQEQNDRLLSQENCFLGQYLVPAKLHALNSGVKNNYCECASLHRWVWLGRAICFSKVHFSWAFLLSKFLSWNLIYNSFYTMENPNLIWHFPCWWIKVLTAVFLFFSKSAAEILLNMFFK